jgi:hypothetical protein
VLSAGYVLPVQHHVINLNRQVTNGFLCAVMAGLAPEGSQYDAKQYDAKMNDLWVPYLKLWLYSNSYFDWNI